MSNTAKAYAAFGPRESLGPFSFERRDVRPNDVAIDILYCGVCHSDLHVIRDDWGGSVYPCVPGHEIIGRVRQVGTEVTKFHKGELVGVGSLVGSCQKCAACDEGEEQYCEGSGPVFTLGSPDPISGGVTRGGFSDYIVVDHRFVVNIKHDERDLAAVAPLLCAGVTTWSPLRHWGVGPGSQVGVVGLGGLGHMAVKLAAALGATVVVFTRSADKAGDALALGAHQIVISTDAEQMAQMAGRLNLIIDTAAASHDLDALLPLLRRDGTLVLLGIPEEAHPSPSIYNLVIARRSIAGTNVGSVAETQEMLDFCYEKGITADVEVISIQDIDRAFERMEANDIKYRFVIDMKSLA